MKPCLLLLAAALVSGAPVHDLDGTWKAIFLCPKEQLPKMFSNVLLDIKVEGDTITGESRMGNWPGIAPISDGKVDGDQVVFTVIGRLWSSSGYPRVRFRGTRNGDAIQLKMFFGYMGRNEANDREYPMEATRVADSR